MKYSLFPQISALKYNLAIFLRDPPSLDQQPKPNNHNKNNNKKNIF